MAEASHSLTHDVGGHRGLFKFSLGAMSCHVPEASGVN